MLASEFMTEATETPPIVLDNEVCDFSGQSVKFEVDSVVLSEGQYVNPEGVVKTERLIDGFQAVIHAGVSAHVQIV